MTKLSKILIKKEQVPLALFILSMFFIVFCANYFITGNEEYVLLAESFLKGHLYLDIPRPDSVFFNGQYFWHLGPFPAVLLMPFVHVWETLTHFQFRQGFVLFFINIAVFYLTYWLARHFKYSKENSLYLAFAFCFASIYQFNAFLPWVWHFVQVVTVLLLFLSLYEFFTRKRYWLIGILMGLVLLSRYTAVFCLFFYIAILISEYKANRQKFWVNMSQLLVPIAIAGLVLLWYNYARFGNPFDSGYMASNAWLYTEAERFEQLNYGLFQVRNIPTNIYYYFIHGLDPVTLTFKSLWGNTYILKPPFIQFKYPGTSFFIVSPIFLYLFKFKLKDVKNKVAKYALIPCAFIMFLLLIYYWPGWMQMGPRYMLDFLPFLYIVLLHSFENRQLSRLAKIVILLSALLNCYLFLTH